MECSFPLCVACNFESSTPRLTLRGMCPGFNRAAFFDSQYTLAVDEYRDGKRFFRGFYGSEIRWDVERRHWMLVAPNRY